MGPALNRGFRKGGREIIQFIAAGGATALIGVLTGHLSPELVVIVGVLLKFFVTFSQNTLETAGKIPVLLPSAGLVTTTAGGAVSKVVGTVDTVVQATTGTATAATQVVGDVVSTSGQVVGGVTGAVGGVVGGLLGALEGTPPNQG